MNICPICHRPYAERPALSRRDGKTDICPDCGMREALEDFARASTPKIISTATTATGNKNAPV